MIELLKQLLRIVVTELLKAGERGELSAMDLVDIDTEAQKLAKFGPRP